jgi:hypothetical protein
MTIIVNVCSTWGMFQIKTRFETWITSNGVNGLSLFHFTYLITLIVYLWSQWTPNVQFKYFMFDCSIYRLFVLNRCWQRGSFQIMIFVYVSSTWSIVELNTHFEKWITRNDVNGVSLYHLSYLISLMTYLCSQRTANVQIRFFKFDWSIYGRFVPHTYLIRDSHHIMIFVNVSSTWSMVELIMRFETWISRIDVNGVSLIKHFNLITCSHNEHQMSKSSILSLIRRFTDYLC